MWRTPANITYTPANQACRSKERPIRHFVRRTHHAFCEDYNRNLASLMAWIVTWSTDITGIGFATGCVSPSALINPLQTRSISSSIITLKWPHDNDCKHTAGHMKEWLHNHNITVLPWPSWHEHHWTCLGWAKAPYYRICCHNPLPPNLKELWAALQQEWYGLENDLISKVYHFLPEHVHALREAQSGHTHY